MLATASSDGTVSALPPPPPPPRSLAPLQPPLPLPLKHCHSANAPLPLHCEHSAAAVTVTTTAIFTVTCHLTSSASAVSALLSQARRVLTPVFNLLCRGRSASLTCRQGPGSTRGCHRTAPPLPRLLQAHQAAASSSPPLTTAQSGCGTGRSDTGPLSASMSSDTGHLLCVWWQLSCMALHAISAPCA